MLPKFTIKFQTEEGGSYKTAFTWTRDAKSGIERARFDAAEFLDEEVTSLIAVDYETHATVMRWTAKTDEWEVF